MIKTLNRKVIGIVLILITLLSLGFWELWGRKNIGYERIPVLSKSVEQHTILTESLITYKPMETPSKAVMRQGDLKAALGMEAGQFIPAGEPLYAEYFQESLFAVGEKRGRYVLSIPEHWLCSYPQTIRRGDKAFFYCRGELITEAIVAYSRGDDNQEVFSQDGGRLSGSDNVSLLEIIVDQEKMKLLSEQVEKGNQFVILYY